MFFLYLRVKTFYLSKKTDLCTHAQRTCSTLTWPDLSITGTPLTRIAYRVFYFFYFLKNVFETQICCGRLDYWYTADEDCVPGNFFQCFFHFFFDVGVLITGL